MGMGWDALDGRGKGGVTEIDRNRTFDQIGGNHNPTCSADAVRTRRVENRKMELWHRDWLNEAYRVLQPGGIIKAFSGTRTFHRLAAAMEEAGFTDIHLEVWAYGSGFPKSLNISKALDKAAGAEREVISTTTINNNFYATDGHSGEAQEHHRKKAEGVKITAPATEEAKVWDGWGTALKPAWEPVLVGRKS